MRGRRQLLTPADAGIPSTRRRRTPGLRRGEVAELAGISPDWYTRIELGTGASASAATLQAIARALQLSKIDTDYIFELSGLAVPKPFGSTGSHDTGNIERLVASVDPNQAAVVVGDVFGFPRCWNATVDAMFRWSSYADALHRNILVAGLTDPYYREFLGEDFEAAARTAIGVFRRAYTTLEPTPLAHRVYEYLQDHPTFRELWNQHTVAVQFSPPGPFYRYVPGVGRLRLTFTDWHAVPGGGLVMRVFVPEDDATREHFAQLAKIGTPSHFRDGDE